MNDKQRIIIDEFFAEDEKYWERKDNMITPPLHCMETYWKCCKDITKIRVISLFPFKYSQVQQVLKSFSTLSSFYSLWKVVKLEDRNLYTIMLNSLTINGMFTVRVDVFDIEKKGTICVGNEFNPEWFSYHLQYCCQEQQGVKHVIEIAINNKYNFKQLCYRANNFLKKVVHFLFEQLCNNVEGRIMSEMEQMFNDRMWHMSWVSKLIHRNNNFTIYSTDDYSEIVVQGKSKFQTDFGSIVDSFYNNSKTCYLYPTNILIRETDRCSIYHRESPFFAPKIVFTDELCGSTIVDGSIFVGRQSVKEKECSICSTNEKEFECVISGERVEWYGDYAESYYFYHYFTPLLKNCPKEVLKRNILNFTSAIYLTRIGIEQNIHPKNFLNPFCRVEMESRILQESILTYAKSLLKTIQSKNNEVICNKRTDYVCYFDNLKNEMILGIIQWLHLKDILLLKQTCKRMKNLIDGDREIMRRFYDSNFSPITFGKHPSIEDFCYKEPNDYYYAIKKFSIMKRNLKKKRIFERKRICLQDNSINWLKFHGNYSIVAVSRKGRIQQIDLLSYTTKTIITNHPGNIIGFNINNKHDNVFVLYNGEMMVYSNQLSKYQTAVIPQCDKGFITNENVFCGVSNTSFTLFDYIEQKESFEYNFSGIDSCYQINPFVYSLNCLDSKVRLVDVRIKQKTVEGYEMNEIANVTCGFDDYLFLGGRDGVVRMFDYRKKYCCMDKKMCVGEVKSIDVYNRRLVVGGEDGFVLLTDCIRGWFGNVDMVVAERGTINSLLISETNFFVGTSGGVINLFDYSQM